MESFKSTKSHSPLTSVDVSQGGTVVLELAHSFQNEIEIECNDVTVAHPDLVRKLADPSKKSYNDVQDESLITTKDVSQKLTYVQITGLKPGVTQLTARYKFWPGEYASPVSVVVKPNPKKLMLPGSPLFRDLWNAHPYVSHKLEDEHHPCQGNHGVTWMGGQCMVRFCTALHENNIKIERFFGVKCGYGKGHEHHFVNPYDFEKWWGLKDAYIWQAAPPLQAEPMPGIAALNFMLFRWKGIVLFWNYWDSKGGKVSNMSGGHIDLFNGLNIGNNLHETDPGFGAYWRSRRVVFWPLEPYTHT